MKKVRKSYPRSWELRTSLIRNGKIETIKMVRDKFNKSDMDAIKIVTRYLWFHEDVSSKGEYKANGFQFLHKTEKIIDNEKNINEVIRKEGNKMNVNSENADTSENLFCLSLIVLFVVSIIALIYWFGFSVLLWMIGIVFLLGVIRLVLNRINENKRIDNGLKANKEFTDELETMIGIGNYIDALFMVREKLKATDDFTLKVFKRYLKTRKLSF